MIKKRALLILFLVMPLYFLIYKQALAAPPGFENCMQMNGTFTADNWPGGQIDLSCPGSGGDPNADPRDTCFGNSQSISPGESFNFPLCNCHYGNCLVSNNLPTGCTLDAPLTCGSNTNSPPDASFHITCQPPATQSPSPPAQTPVPPACDCNTVIQQCVAPDGSQGHQACSGTTVNGVCQASSDASCSNNCGPCVPLNSPSTPPTPAPTVPNNPTIPGNPPPAQCNSACANPNDCLRAGDGCTFCGQNGTCQAPPGPVPSGPPTQCNSACANPNDCLRASDGCTFCNANGTCQAPPGPSQPTQPPQPSAPVVTPSPTPVATCTCDGLQVAPANAGIFPGYDISFTASGLVTGNTTLGYIKNMIFTMTKGNDPSRQAPIAGPSTVLAALNKGSQNRYSATWPTHIPADIPIDTRVTVFAEITCANRAATGSLIGLSVTHTTDTNIFQRIWQKILGVFGKGQQLSSPVATQPTAPLMSVAPTQSQPASFAVGDEKQLQLKTFYPADVEPASKTSCKFFFRFPKPKATPTP